MKTNRIGPACAGLLAVATSLCAAGPTAQALLASSEIKKALAAVDRDMESLVEEWIRISSVAAPSGQEAARASLVEARFRKAGLVEVHRDAEGNVLGKLKGATSLPSVALAAHLDTVAPAEADHEVKRLAGGRLQGPGIRDDSSGLAAMMAVMDLMVGHNLTPHADLWFVATVREETGLHGAELFVAEHGHHLGAFVAVDGSLGQISCAATAISWLELHFLSPGAHTLNAHENPSAILGAARAIEKISAIPLRRSPERMESWLNIGMIGGGDVPNAQPRDVWFTVDIRSNDPETFSQLEARVLDEARRVAREMSLGFEHQVRHRREGRQLPGVERSLLVRSARETLRALGWSPISVMQSGTADHNVALLRGIPAIAVGVTTGNAAHTQEETADVAPMAIGIKQLLLLVMQPLTSPEPPAAF